MKITSKFLEEINACPKAIKEFEAQISLAN